MDEYELAKALRRHIKTRRQELLESLLIAPDVEKARGRVAELDAINNKLAEILKTTGDDSDR